MNLSRLLTWLLAAASVVSVAHLQASTVTTHPYCGVTYITRTETSPWLLSMNIVVIDLATPGLRFKLTPPGGSRETVEQTTLDFLNQEKAQAAINAHFFLPFPPDDPNDMDANLVGLAASDGIVFSSFEPQPVGADYVDQSYAIVPYAPALNIDRFNRATIVHRDPAYPDNKHVLERTTLWNALAGSAQIIRNGVKTIPTYSGPPNGLNPIDGYSDQFDWYSYARARTCIGLTMHNEKLVWFTVDEAGESFGMTVEQAAELLIKDYHVYNALNLDGGGSTTMALQNPSTHVGQIVNVPSDNSDGRANGSNLAVFAQPYTESVPILVLTAAASNGLVISWPASATGWRLQHSPGLNPAHWANVSTNPERVGDCLQVSVTPQGAGQFYRLTK